MGYIFREIGCIFRNYTLRKKCVGKHFSCQRQYKAKIEEIAAQNFSATWSCVSDEHQVHQLDVAVLCLSKSRIQLLCNYFLPQIRYCRHIGPLFRTDFSLSVSTTLSNLVCKICCHHSFFFFFFTILFSMHR